MGKVGPLHTTCPHAAFRGLGARLKSPKPLNIFKLATLWCHVTRLVELELGYEIEEEYVE